MRYTIIIVSTIAALFFCSQPILASSAHGQGDATSHDAKNPTKDFKHSVEADGVRSEFQIMRLADMNMKDEHGETHHVMVKVADAVSNKEIKDAVGKIKIIAPDGSEQEGVLKNYSGIFAANFTFKADGKYGVICLLKIDGRKKIMKFWYPHES